MQIFFTKYPLITTGPRLVEFADAEQWTPRAYYKVIGIHLTVWGVGAPHPALFKDQLYFLLFWEEIV